MNSTLTHINCCKLNHSLLLSLYVQLSKCRVDREAILTNAMIVVHEEIAAQNALNFAEAAHYEASEQLRQNPNDQHIQDAFARALGTLMECQKTLLARRADLALQGQWGRVSDPQ